MLLNQCHLNMAHCKIHIHLKLNTLDAPSSEAVSAYIKKNKNDDKPHQHVESY